MQKIRSQKESTGRKKMRFGPLNPPQNRKNIYRFKESSNPNQHQPMNLSDRISSEKNRGNQSARLIKENKLGQGTYGTVYKARFEKTGLDLSKYGLNTDQVAVKRNIVDDKASFLVPVRELSILNKLRGHPFLIRLLTISIGNPFVRTIQSNGKYYQQTESLDPIRDATLRGDELYFVFENAAHDCHTLIYERDLTGSVIKLSMVQMLLGMEYLHSQGVVHRDLKPSNLLFFRDDQGTIVKMCDFGLSKYVTEQEPMTPRTVTAWYRAPEIVCGWKNYGQPIDCWSIGCIFFELLARKALFYRTEDKRHKIFTKMMQTLPANRIDDLNQVDIHNFFPEYRSGPRPWKSPSSWREIIHLTQKQVQIFNNTGKGGSYGQFLDMLDGLLHPDPRLRSTATKALNHRFFDGYRDYIETTRTLYPPVKNPSPIIEILDREERHQAVNVAYYIYNHRAEHRQWYTHRIIFQALDIFDRYLVWIDKTQILSGYESPKPRLDNNESQFRFMVCLYLSMKIFTTTRIRVGFRDIVPDSYRTPYYLKLAETFESQLITEVLELNIYRPTVYEEADNLGIKLTEVQIMELLIAHGKTGNVKSSAENLLKRYLSRSSDQSPEDSPDYAKGVDYSKGVDHSKDHSKVVDYSEVVDYSKGVDYSGQVDYSNVVDYAKGVDYSGQVDYPGQVDYSNVVDYAKGVDYSGQVDYPGNKSLSRAPDDKSPVVRQNEDDELSYLNSQTANHSEEVTYPEEKSPDEGLSDRLLAQYSSRFDLPEQVSLNNEQSSPKLNFRPNNKYMKSTNSKREQSSLQGNHHKYSQTFCPNRSNRGGLSGSSFAEVQTSGLRPRMLRLDESGKRKVPLDQAGLFIKI